MTGEDPTAVITTVLHGRGEMPAFEDNLSTQQIAAVTSYIRNAWDNSAAVVMVAQARQVKQGGSASTSSEAAAPETTAENASSAAEGTPAATTSTATTADLPLTEFLALSTVLTGVANLNPAVGRIYWQSLQASDEFAISVADLYEQTGFRSAAPPSTVADLEAAGLFTQETTRSLADKIIELWYTGIYTNADGEATVATFVDALAWQTLAFTKPMTICGYPGFWSEAWEPILD